MPAASVDTFFACLLMVLLVLSAMGSTSKLLFPYMNNAVDRNIDERYEQISKYLLLNAGTPTDWGQNSQTLPTAFGLARAGSENPYELDIDKVSRLGGNIYAMSYAQAYSALEMSDVSFRIEVKPLFEVVMNLTATFDEESATLYQFTISTEKHGVPVLADLRCYVVTEDYLRMVSTLSLGGRLHANVSLPNDVGGPALFVVLARATCDNRIVSFNFHAFAHNSTQPKPNGTFIRLSPLNHTLTASLIESNVTLTKAYALTFSYNSTLTQIASNNQSATYSIPHFADSSPTIIVATGTNSTAFFIEQTAYPQIPLQIGANFASVSTRTSIFAYTYPVTIASAIYECTIWLGGPRD